MLSLFTIKPTEKNMQLARAAQIYYHQGAYSDDKPEQKAEQKPVVEPKPEQKPKAEQKAEQKPVVEPKPEQKPKAEQKPEQKPKVEPKPEQKPKVEPKPEQKPKAEQKPEQKPVVEPKPEQKPVVEPKPEQKPVVEPKPEQKPKAEQKPEQKPKAEQKPVVEVLDRDGNIVAMLPGVPEEAPRAARTTAAFDINNFVKPAEQKASTNSTKLNNVKSIDEVYTFIRNTGVSAPFDPMPGYSAAEKTRILKGYANFNGTHPGMDILQLNTLIMIFNSPDLARKMINCGLDPKQVLGVKRFNEVPANKYDNNNAYDFAFEYTLSKKKKLVLLVNSIPTYDEKQGWMSGYNISVR